SSDLTDQRKEQLPEEGVEGSAGTTRRRVVVDEVDLHPRSSDCGAYGASREIEQRSVGDDAEVVHFVVRIDTEFALYCRNRGRIIGRAVAEGIERRRRIGIRQRLIERSSGNVVQPRTLLVDALARECLH